MLLAALVGCSSGGSDDADPSPYVPPRWANQQRVPTASHLRGVRFNTSSQGFVAGEDTSLFRFAVSYDPVLLQYVTTWVQEEHQPFNRGGNIEGLDILGPELQAVGADENGLGRQWTSTDAVNWTTADAAGAGAKFVAVDVTAGLTGGPPNVTWALRENWDIRLSNTAGAVANNTGIPDPPGGLKATSIDMLYSGPGYVVGEGGRIFETSSHGNPVDYPDPTPDDPGWTLRSSGGTNALRDVQIVEAGIGFACGDDGTLVYTEDGGDFAPIPGGPTGVVFRGLFFIHSFQTTSLGWVVGDGGAIWRVSGTYTPPVVGPPVVPGFWTWTWTQVANASTDNLYDVHFASSTFGFAVGDNGRVVQLVDDGNATAATQVTKGSLDAINAVSFEPTGTVGVAVGDNGKVYKTLNGGTAWTEVDLGSQTWTGVSVPRGNGNVAYICGLGGEIRRNLDLAGGNTWQPAAGGALAGQNFRAILFPSSADVGFAVGDGKTLLYTNTGTSTFTWAAPAGMAGLPTSDFKAVCTNFHGGGTDLFAAGTNGVLVTNTLVNYANAWSVAAGPGGAGIGQAIQAPVPDMVVLAMDDAGQRLHRRMAGSWLLGASQPSPTPPTALGLAWAGPSLGWWVSDGIYTTENGANTSVNDWKRSPVHTQSTFRGVWMSQAGTVGYVVGTNGAILKTVTGGK